MEIEEITGMVIDEMIAAKILFRDGNKDEAWEHIVRARDLLEEEILCR